MTNQSHWGRGQEQDQLFDVGPRGQQIQENIRLFVTLRKDGESNMEYKKLTVMAPMNLKISMLKRHVEREFADLFPHEPTFICAKLEDEFGYSLSNTSYVSELLKNSDRLFAVPELFSKDLIGKMHVTHDLNELTFMLKSIQQTIIAKLAEANLGSPEIQLEILQLVVPIGFSLQQKAINHNSALTIKRILESERLDFIQDPSYALLVNLLVKLMTFWVNDLIFQDSFLLNLTIDILEILVKSAKFANLFKSASSINSLMVVSKLDFVSAQTRSRIIKLISYLSRPSFADCYEPRPYDGPIEIPDSRGGRRRPPQPRGNDELNYQPSLLDREQPRRPASFRGRNEPMNNEYPDPRPQDRNEYRNPANPTRMPDQDYRQGAHQIPNPRRQEVNKNEYRPAEPRVPKQEYSSNGLQLDRQRPGQPQGSAYNQGNQGPASQASKFPKQSAINDYNPQNQVFDGLVQDYLNLISQESSEDMLIFAVQNLSDGIDQSIHSIMDNKGAYQQCINLLEIALAPEYMQMQIKVLDAMAKNMNETRAKEGIKLRIVHRIMKAFTYQPKEFHGVLFELLSAHLQQSDFQVDVSTVIALIECPYIRVSQLGIKILALISDSNRLSSSNLASQFENYVKQIMDWSLDGSKGDEYQYNALLTLSNLSLNDIVRPQILYLKGIEFFLRILRESHRIDAQRAAAKALLNLSIKSRETKLQIVSQLGEEIQLMQKGGLDAIVQGYLQTLISTRDKRQMI